MRKESRDRPFQLHYYISSTLKGAAFLGALYLCGSIFPFIFLTAGSNILIDFWLPAGLVLLALIIVPKLLLAGNFFTRLLQRLKPFLFAAILVWLIPFVGYMVFSCIGGNMIHGVPLPVDAGGWAEPWPTIFLDSFRHMSAMLGVLALACIAARRLPAIVVRMTLVGVFLAFCASVSCSALDYFICSWSTWEKWEIKELALSNLHILAFWLLPALYAAWRITGEFMAIPAFTKPRMPVALAVCCLLLFYYSYVRYSTYGLIPAWFLRPG